VSAWNVIERAFGILKKRFWILLLPPAYNMATQVQILVALCCIYNFICAHDSEEGVLPGDDHIPDFGESDDDPGDDIQLQVVAADFGKEVHGRGVR
jgi:hypothetical protein